MNRSADTGTAPAASAPARYRSLDLLRGVAAFLVLLYHMDFMFGAKGGVLPGAYLSVDLFFLLSGFVIAANYSLAVRPALGWSDFVAARIARLWPLFVLATGLGFMILGAKHVRDFGYFATGPMLSTLALNAAMLPALVLPYGIERLFPFNGASWSVFFELVVNVIYFAVLRRFGGSLLGFVAVGLLLLSTACYVNGGLDGGWSPGNAWVGLIRALSGFTLGVWIFEQRARFRFELRPLPALILPIAFVLILSLKPSAAIDLAVTLVFAPILLVATMRAQFAPAVQRVGTWLGDISYSVYLLQTPLIVLYSGLFQVLGGKKIAEYAPLAGVFFLPPILVCCHLCWRYFEMPMRKSLLRRLAARA